MYELQFTIGRTRVLKKIKKYNRCPDFALIVSTGLGVGIKAFVRFANFWEAQRNLNLDL
jgi:hypothetical protein